MVISEVVVLRLEKRYISCYQSNTIVQGSYEFVLPRQLVLYCVVIFCKLLCYTSRMRSIVGRAVKERRAAICFVIAFALTIVS